MASIKKILSNKSLFVVALCLVALLVIAGCASTFVSRPAPAIPAAQSSPQAPVTETPKQSEQTAPPVEAPVKELSIEAFNFGFKMNDVQINKGDKVRLTFSVTSGFHSLAIPDFDVNTGTVNEGESKTVEFVADKAGSFPFRCNVPCGAGHMSMKGTLVVS